MKLLNLEGLSQFWDNIKSYFDKNIQGIEIEYIDDLLANKVEFYDVQISVYMNYNYTNINRSLNITSITISRNDVSNIIPNNIDKLNIIKITKEKAPDVSRNDLTIYSDTCNIYVPLYYISDLSSGFSSTPKYIQISDNTNFPYHFNTSTNTSTNPSTNTSTNITTYYIENQEYNGILNGYIKID